MTRRSFFRNGLAALASALVAYPLFSFWNSQRFRPPVERRISRALKPGEFVIEPEFVLFQTDAGPYAVSRTCTHLGCRINYIEAKSIFLCPCHQSRFKKSGAYISGPARKDLPRFPVKVLENEAGYVVYIPR